MIYVDELGAPKALSSTYILLVSSIGFVPFFFLYKFL